MIQVHQQEPFCPSLFCRFVVVAICDEVEVQCAPRLPQVSLDLWDSLHVAEEGSMAWFCRQIRDNDFVLVICSRGLCHRREPPDAGDEEESVRLNNFTSDVMVHLVAEEVGRTKAGGRDLSKYLVATFEYSDDTDIPNELRLVSHYKLPSNLQLLFSHLHQVPLHRPGAFLSIHHFSEEGFSQSPAGAALQRAIYEAGRLREKHLARGVL